MSIPYQEGRVPQETGSYAAFAGDQIVYLASPSQLYEISPDQSIPLGSLPGAGQLGLPEHTPGSLKPLFQITPQRTLWLFSYDHDTQHLPVLYDGAWHALGHGHIQGNIQSWHQINPQQLAATTLIDGNWVLDLESGASQRHPETVVAPLLRSACLTLAEAQDNAESQELRLSLHRQGEFLLVRRQLRPRLRVPVVIHQVDNPTYATRDFAPLRVAWNEMLPGWEQADIDWDPTWITTPVSDAELEQAFDNDASQPPIQPRLAQSRGLQGLPTYDPHALNLFVLRDVPTIGNPGRSSYHQSRRQERLALISLRFPELTRRILQAALARLLGLGWDADKPADEFLKVVGSVSHLRPDQQEKLRAGAAELQGGAYRHPDHPALTVDLQIHLVVSPTYGSQRTPEGVDQLVRGINRYWEQAGIVFRAAHVKQRHLSDSALQSAFENRDQYVIPGRRTSTAALCSMPGYQPQAINLFCLGRVDLVGTTHFTELQAWSYPANKILLLADAADSINFRRCASELCNFFGIPRNQDASTLSLRNFHQGGLLTVEEIEQVRKCAQMWTEAKNPPECQLLIVPLRLHRVTTPLTPAQIEALIHEVNQIWAQAGIQFAITLVDTPLTPAELESACPNDALHPPLGNRKGSFEALRTRPEYISGQANLFLVDQVMSVGSKPGKMWATFEGRDGLATTASDVVVSKVVALTLGLQLGLPASPDLYTSLLMCNKVGSGLLLTDTHISLARQTAAQLASARSLNGLEPTLAVPISFHLVCSPGHTSNRDEQNLQLVVDRINRIWIPAGIAFQIRGVFPLELQDGEIEPAFPNSPTQPIAGRIPSCRELLERVKTAEEGLHVFCVRTVQGIGSAPPHPPLRCISFPTVGVALLGDEDPSKCLAALLSTFLGLQWSQQPLPAHRLCGAVNAPGIELTAQEIASARQAAQRYQSKLVQVTPPPAQETFEQVMGELNGMVGMPAVKKQLTSLLNHARIESMRRQRGGRHNPVVLHALFEGANGTGKSSIARLIARFYRCLGLLSGGQVVEVSRVDLIVEGRSMLQPYLDKAENGLLFIDDAPALGTKKTPDPLGKVVISQLLRRLEQNSENLAVVLSGYPAEMSAFLEHNPGLAHRFRHRLEFPHFSAEELTDLFAQFASTRGFLLSQAVTVSLRQLFGQICQERDRLFGNGHYVHNLFHDTLEGQASRLIELPSPSDDDLVTLTVEDVPGLTQVRKYSQEKSGWDPSAIRISDPPVQDSLDQVLEELSRLIGLHHVKEQVRSLCNYLTAQQKRRQEGLTSTPLCLHMIFSGPVGTGKTTVARLMGRLLRCLGYLSRGHLLETDRSGLVAGYSGQTALKVNETMDQAMGGVLFIDEAYALAPGHPTDLGAEAISTLLKRMEDSKDRVAVIVAGYPDKMDKFMEANPGLRSRFAHTIGFQDYTPAELLEIFQSLCEQSNYQISQQAEVSLSQRLRWMSEQRRADFGNGRLVRNLFEKALQRQSNRLAGLTGPVAREALSLLDQEDIPPAESSGGSLAMEKGSSMQSTARHVEDSLEQVMAELDALVGLQRVKEQLRSLANFISTQLKRNQEGLSSASVSAHMVFSGSPGTGKTTVARLVGRLLKCMGLLQRGQLIETDRSGLVAGWVGQTALKVNETVDQALDGVLFIDEAYTLIQGKPGVDFGEEAISTLIKRMEDGRDRLVVIAAGYPRQMEELLERNPGLRSRFSHVIQFEDYNLDELAEIFECFCRDSDYTLTAAAGHRLRRQLDWLYQQKGQDFGNGRLVRSLFEQALEQQSNRLAAIANPDRLALSQLIEEDISLAQGSALFSSQKDSYVLSEPPPGDSMELILCELDELVGLNEVKHRVRTLINLIKVNRLRLAEGLTPTPIGLHLVFSGKPGTGKTTVARLIGRIYRALGLLLRGQLLETTSAGLTAAYRGESANKVNDVVDRSLHGVLFIDEAYALSPNQEAVSALVKRLEDERERLAVVLAGYTREMEGFLSSNAGLRSRFHPPVVFPDYTPPELLQIFLGFCRHQGLTAQPEALTQVEQLLSRAYAARDHSFGNGRLARHLFEQCLERQANRIADNPHPQDLQQLRLEDIPDTAPNPRDTRPIGFRQNR